MLQGHVTLSNQLSELLWSQSMKICQREHSSLCEKLLKLWDFQRLKEKKEWTQKKKNWWCLARKKEKKNLKPRFQRRIRLSGSPRGGSSSFSGRSSDMSRRSGSGGGDRGWLARLLCQNQCFLLKENFLENSGK